MRLSHLHDGNDIVGRLALEANADARLAHLAARGLESQGGFRGGAEEGDEVL